MSGLETHRQQVIAALRAVGVSKSKEAEIMVFLEQFDAAVRQGAPKSSLSYFVSEGSRLGVSLANLQERIWNLKRKPWLDDYAREYSQDPLLELRLVHNVRRLLEYVENLSSFSTGKKEVPDGVLRRAVPYIVQYISNAKVDEAMPDVFTVRFASRFGEVLPREDRDALEKLVAGTADAVVKNYFSGGMVLRGDLMFAIEALRSSGRLDDGLEGKLVASLNPMDISSPKLLDALNWKQHSSTVYNALLRVASFPSSFKVRRWGREEWDAAAVQHLQWAAEFIDRDGGMPAHIGLLLASAIDALYGDAPEFSRIKEIAAARAANTPEAMEKAKATLEELAAGVAAEEWSANSISKSANIAAICTKTLGTALPVANAFSGLILRALSHNSDEVFRKGYEFAIAVYGSEQQIDKAKLGAAADAVPEMLRTRMYAEPEIRWHRFLQEKLGNHLKYKLADAFRELAPRIPEGAPYIVQSFAQLARAAGEVDASGVPLKRLLPPNVNAEGIAAALTSEIQSARNDHDAVMEADCRAAYSAVFGRAVDEAAVNTVNLYLGVWHGHSRKDDEKVPQSAHAQAYEFIRLLELRYNIRAEKVPGQSVALERGRESVTCVGIAVSQKDFALLCKAPQLQNAVYMVGTGGHCTLNNPLAEKLKASSSNGNTFFYGSLYPPRKLSPYQLAAISGMLRRRPAPAANSKI